MNDPAMTVTEAIDLVEAALPWRLWEAAGENNELIRASRLVLAHARATCSEYTVTTAAELDRLPDCTVGYRGGAAVKRNGRWSVTGMMLLADSARSTVGLPARVLDVGGAS